MKKINMKKIYSIKTIIVLMESLLEDGYKTINLLELLETIGFEERDLEEILKIKEENCK